MDILGIRSHGVQCLTRGACVVRCRAEDEVLGAVCDQKLSQIVPYGAGGNGRLVLGFRECSQEAVEAGDVLRAGAHHADPLVGLGHGGDLRGRGGRDGVRWSQ